LMAVAMHQLDQMVSIQELYPIRSRLCADKFYPGQLPGTLTGTFLRELAIF
jgi:hypothetical protein